jgi:hypothetical protein
LISVGAVGLDRSLTLDGHDCQDPRVIGRIRHQLVWDASLDAEAMFDTGEVTLAYSEGPNND